MFPIRLATARDLPSLPGIERAAAALFRATPYPHLADAPLASERLDLTRDRVWVADAVDKPVGFVIVHLHDDAAHIHEIDVHPEFARRGIGAALILAVNDWAAKQGVPNITLTTFDDVPWNAPCYARLGFEVLAPDAWTPALLSVRHNEQRAGLPMTRRVCMRRSVTPQ